MPRTKRLLCDDSVYHVMQKGNNGLKLCKDHEDFSMLLKCIKKHLRKFKISVYHYCLMATHLHLLLKLCSKDELAKFMQGLLQSYGFYYKRKYGYRGYLYQNRYKSKKISNDEYLLECGRYIERNPVRAGIVKTPDEYKWSSCSHYTQGDYDGIITDDFLYGNFGKNLKDRQCGYKEYVSTSRPYEDIIDKEFSIK